MLTPHEVLGLELVAAARRVVHPEVREPLEPWPGHAELRRARIGGSTGHGVARGDRAEGAVERGPNRFRRRVAADPPLEPHLVDHRPAPRREQAHAVRRGSDVVEPAQERFDREVLEHVLAHRVARLHGEDEPGDDAEGTQRHHRAREQRRSLGPPQGHELAVRAHDVELDHRRREAPAPVAGPVRRGGARAGHRDVRERRQVVECEPGPVQRSAQLAVAHAAVDRDRAGYRIDLDRPWETCQRHEVAARVGEVVEGVPGADGAHRVGRRARAPAAARRSPARESPPRHR